MTIAAAIAAQTPFPLQEVRNEHLPPVAANFLVADLDGDGLDDLIAATNSGQRLWANRSRARFVDVTAQSLPLSAPGIALAFDADGDGDVDLAAFGPSLLRNDGRGVFTLASRGNTSMAPLVAGDFDRDGDTDMLALQFGSRLVTLRNDGSGSFTEASSSQYGDRPPIVTLAADFDGDGDLDIALAGLDVRGGFGENDGRGNFSWTALFPAGFVAATDLDGDGDVDLFSGALALINDGLGRFTDEAAQRFPRRDYGAVVNLDVDRDGDRDLVLASGEIWLNDGRGVFAAVPAPELARNHVGRLLAARIDGDRELDLVAGPGHLFLARGPARFVPLDPAALGAATAAVQIGDLTGDGDPDVLERFDSGGLGYRTRANDGSGFFTPLAATAVWPSVPFAAHEALGDLDGDGDLDVLGSYGGPTRGLVMVPNQGSGVFGTARPAPYSRNGVPLAIYLDDLDRDGDLDALDVSTEGLVVALNDGTGGFAAGNLAWAGFPVCADHADFDGDGDLDVLAARDQLTLLENRQGTFVDVTAQYFTTPPVGFGRPVVVAAANTTWLLWPRIGVVDVYERVGTAFVARPQLGLAYAGEALAAQRLDTAAGVARVHVQRRAATGIAATILQFDGQTLRDVTAEVLPSYFVNVVCAADLDVDGDTDIVAIDSLGHAAALHGQARALRTRYTPFVGGSVELAIRDTAATQQRPVGVVGLLGLPTRLPFPGLGVLRIDPRVAVFLPSTTIFWPVETGLSIPVPADPALRDIEFGVQFAHVDAAAAVALGPLARVTVR